MDYVTTTTKFIQNVYDNYNISHSLVVYDSSSVDTTDIDKLLTTLADNYFPIYHIKDESVFNVSSINTLELNNRMFLLDVQLLHSLSIAKEGNFSNISVIFCLSQDVFNKTCETLTKYNISHPDEMHLFSC